ncbi:response regulator PleD [bacterium BMS3Bbin06]|nr:response regulator PleD [bacterium BMS3Abin08]GBE35626.1 response regulator PleD [bacterium BMS3Bbin06]
MHSQNSDKKKLLYCFGYDPSYIDNLSFQISHFNYDVRKLLDTATLLNSLSLDSPSCVIIDTSFSGDELRDRDILSSLKPGDQETFKLIFVADRGDVKSRLNALRLGADAYFVKPVNMIELIDAVDALTSVTLRDPYRILIVDDDKNLSTYHSLLLRREGMITEVVNEPLNVFNVLFDFKPDLILMDMYMPLCNGDELARVIRQMNAYYSIPIVYLSAEKDISVQLSAMSMGGDDFITKPVDPDYLISSVTIRAERMRIIRSFMDRDSLTGLLNHTKTKEQLDIAIRRVKREEDVLAFAMIDIDHFKEVNDTYGHPAGDMVLIALSRLLQQRLRSTDIIGRYGGEEFAVVLYGTSPESAFATMDDIRTRFENIKHHYEGRSFRVTFSCGIASFPDHADAQDLNKSADVALYRAKREGRNRVVLNTQQE